MKVGLITILLLTTLRLYSDSVPAFDLNEITAEEAPFSHFPIDTKNVVIKSKEIIKKHLSKTPYDKYSNEELICRGYYINCGLGNSHRKGNLQDRTFTISFIVKSTLNEEQLNTDIFDSSTYLDRPKPDTAVFIDLQYHFADEKFLVSVQEP